MIIILYIINNLIQIIMKYGKILLGNGVEFLTGTQMKGTRGGNGYGYYIFTNNNDYNNIEITLHYIRRRQPSNFYSRHVPFIYLI